VDAAEEAIQRGGLTRLLLPEAWIALAEAMGTPAVMPFQPAYQVKYVDAPAPYPEVFDPEAVSYLGDYHEGVLPHAAAVEWLRVMTWRIAANERYAKYGRWRHEGPSRRVSCEGELRTMLDALRIPFAEDGTGCFVISAFAKPG
jgi:hypothetical protein